MAKKMKSWAPDGRSKLARSNPISKAILKKGKKDDGCFVSTVCFGENSVETEIFRNWRDKYLSERYLGIKFISWYYNNGEKISKIIGRFYVSRLLVSYVLTKFSRLLGKRYR